MRVKTRDVVLGAAFLIAMLAVYLVTNSSLVIR
jgi:hypothetical protein